MMNSYCHVSLVYFNAVFKKIGFVVSKKKKKIGFVIE